MDKIVCIILLFFLFSCDQKQELLKSKKGIDKQLQGKWKREQISGTDPANEVWQSDNGSLRFYLNDTLKKSGTYSVSTTLTKVYVTTDGSSEPCLNGKWNVITLDDHVLVIANDVCGGVTERDFDKQ